MSEPPKSNTSKTPQSKCHPSPQTHFNALKVPLKTCRNCALTWKWLHHCPAEDQTCRCCGKFGHYARMCRYSNQNNNKNPDNRPHFPTLGIPDNDSKSERIFNKKPRNFHKNTDKNCCNDQRNIQSPDNPSFRQFGACDDSQRDSQEFSPVNKKENDNSSQSSSSNYSRKSGGPRGHRGRDRHNYGKRNSTSSKSNEETDGDDKSCKSESSRQNSNYADINDKKNGRNSNNKKNETDWDGKSCKFESSKNSRQYSNYADIDNKENCRDNSIKDNEETDCDAKSCKSESARSSTQTLKSGDTNEKENCGGNSNKNNGETDCDDESRSDNSKSSGPGSNYAIINVGKSSHNSRERNEREDSKSADFSHDDKFNGSKFDDTEDKSATGHSQRERKQLTAIGLQQKLAKSFYDQGNYEAALSHYSRLIDMSPNNPKNFNNRSACYMMMGQYDNSIGDASKVIQLDPSCVKAHSRLIKCSIYIGSTQTAELHIGKVLEMSPNDAIILAERRKLDELQKHLDNESLAMNQANYQDALDSINKCLSISPHCAKYQINKAGYLSLLKRHDEAQQILEEILAKDPINVDAKYILGLGVYYSGLERAVQYFKDVLRLDPDHAPSLAILKKAKKIMQLKEAGNNAFRTNNFNSAHRLYSSALLVDPGNIRIQAKLSYNQGQASFNLMEYERAIREYSQAIAIDANLLNALKQRGKCYMEIKEYEEAIADFSRVCSLDPENECQGMISAAEKLLASVKKDFHEILGVSRYPSIHEVKKAYKDKARDHHPDRHSNDTLEQKMKHERKFKDITMAYRELLETCKRKVQYERSYQ